MPIEESERAWRLAERAGALTDLPIVRLPGVDHLPTLGGRPEPAAISPQFTAALVDWLTGRVG